MNLSVQLSEQRKKSEETETNVTMTWLELHTQVSFVLLFQKEQENVDKLLF